MKNYIQLVSKYLRKQKKRTALTAVGIMLSVSIITSIGILSDGANLQQIENVKKSFGSYHVLFENLDPEEAEVVKNHVRAGKTSIITISDIHGIPGSGRKMAICSIDDYTSSLLDIKLIEGCWPERENEIVLDITVLKDLGIEDELDKKIYLDLGKRKFEFKLVGLYEKSTLFSQMDSSYGIVIPETLKSIGSSDKFMSNVYMETVRDFPIMDSVNKIISDSFGEYKPPRFIKKVAGVSFMDKYISLNLFLLNVLGEGYDNVSNEYKIIQAILVLIVFIATVSGIYNAFNISVLERVRQFGLLRAVGTTPGQIRRIVLGEALLMSMTAIPAGILFGIGISKGFTSFMSELYSISGIFTLSLETLLLSALVSLGAVFFSAYAPSRLASRISPMEAIQDKGTVLAKSKKRKKRKFSFIEKLMGISEIMAYRNLRRNRKRFTITIVSMCIGIVMFMAFSYYIRVYEKLMFDDYIESDYSISVHRWSSDGSIGYPEEILDEIYGIEGVSNIYGLIKTNQSFLLPEDKMTDELKKRSRTAINNPGIYGTNLYLYSLDSHLMECVAGNVKEDLFQKENYKNGFPVMVYEPADEKKWKVGDEITIEKVKTISSAYGSSGNHTMSESTILTTNEMVKLKVAAVLNDAPFTSYKNRPLFFTGMETFKEIYPDAKYNSIYIDVTENADKEYIEPKLTRIAQSVENGQMISHEKKLQELNEMKNQIMLIMYALAACISTIAILNIINTISAHLIIRTREFGIVRAVGMTGKQLKKMVWSEGVLQAMISSLWGCSIGTAVIFAFYWLLKNDGHPIPWELPWKTIFVIFFINIAIGLLATISPLKRISKLNITESVRCESF